LIGDSGVGKSCLLARFTDSTFTVAFINTIGIDFRIKTFDLDGKRIKLQIWDTAGQERFRTITTAYYRGAMGVLLIYDTTHEQSFKNVNEWMHTVDRNASTNIIKVLIGNKCDMVEDKVVDTSIGKALAEKLGALFLETSAKTNLNVEEAFLCITKEIQKRLEAEEIVKSPSTPPSSKSPTPPSSKPPTPTDCPNIPKRKVTNPDISKPKQEQSCC